MTPHTPPLLRRLCAALAFVLPASAALSQDAPPGMVGKNGWLFYHHEFVEDPLEAQNSVDLVARISKVLTANGTQVLVAMAPIKARIYSEHLPDKPKPTSTMLGLYAQLIQSLRAAGVNAVDLNSAFMNSPKRTAEVPLFLRLDTHWSATGALLAAETIRDALATMPDVKKAYDAIPAATYKLTWADQRWPFEGDLVQQLPKGSPAYEKDMISVFSVTKESAAGGALLGAAPEVGVTLMGTSYSADWTHFPAALRYALQRDALSLSIAADQGQWVGLDTYLRNDAFQTNRPKLLIWEMPERDMKAPPDMPYREARYVINNTEWLLRVSALAQKDCTAATTQVRVEPASLGQSNTDAGLKVGATQDTDYVELRFSRPFDRLEYLAAQLTTNGSKTMTLEASGPGVATRKFTLPLAGDDVAHTFKAPLPPKGKNGYTKVKLYPGVTSGFELKGLAICQQPADLLK